MMSLKAFAPILATTLGTTPAAIYERQRALVRRGLLPAPIGRGRGNGLPATAETVAMILIAMMVTDNLSDTDNRVQKLAEAQVNGKRGRGSLKHFKPRCGLTGKRDFKAALIAILRSEELATAVVVQVSRSDLSANIHYDRQGVIGVSKFGEHSPFGNTLEIQAMLAMGALETLCRALQNNSEGDGSPYPFQRKP